ncbi:phosphatidylserine decarboxylase-domain-containing protein [Colletotrichum phormii]|uniref:Phosphatidylserine decarboxylase-domain-containing protein n=1 Tax=Colletotrichum phormii TaxID=359342 RepID=A0AAI9ZET9_9PEZI|nr:phosphatidylserine decarboxylase-domain-containing protein [Colletotrichum phormii]KAK1623243.1 phosphatidylserine decarboxylase-domain-containing protein [Colletotrichum phormii]
MSPKSSSPDPAPFPLPTTVDPWIQTNLIDKIFNGNLALLEDAVAAAVAHDTPQLKDWGIVDAHSFLLFLSAMLNWVPSEVCSGKLIYNTFCVLYFVLDQSPINVAPYSTPIAPNSIGQNPLPLSQWTIDFANKVGSWMGKSSSINAAAIQSFQDSPRYNYDEAIVPSGGWQSINQFFARFLKPGMRPISAGSPSDKDYDRLVVYPADCTFDGAWPVDQNNDISIKNVPWNIKDLLAGSQYAAQFEGGTFMHAYLNTYDYHRQHAPVAGPVVEANVIKGLSYLQVIVDTETGKLKPHRSYTSPDAQAQQNGDVDGVGSALSMPDEAGYQFLQARGCVVIIKNSLLGYVAVLPIGMAQVSSVNLKWQPGPDEQYPIQPNVNINEGDKISHFEFGGSDIILVFQKDAEVHILGAQGATADNTPTSKQKYLVGMPLGYSTKGLTSGNTNGATNGH